MLAANHALLSSTANGTTTTSTTNSSNNNNDGEHDPADHLTRQPFPPLTLSDFDFFSAAAASAANHRPSYTMSDDADSHNLLLNTSATTTNTSSVSVDFLKHRKSSDIDDSSLNLPASPLATTATADELGGASPSLLTEEQMITASQIDRLTAAELLSARNKRKNFQPRNCAGEGDDKKEEKGEEAEEGKEAEQGEDLGSDNLSSKTATEERHQSPTSSPSAKTSPPPPPPETSSPPSTMAESVLSDFVNPITTTSSTTTSSTLTSITANTATTATTSSQQPLDLSAAEQLEQQQQQQKLTEQLLFLKNIRDLSLFYPQLSPHALMAQLQQQPSLLEDSVSAAAAAASSVKDDAPGSPQPPPALSETLEPLPPPPSSSEVEQPQQQSNSSPIEQLLQLYNRDLYLKALQQQQNQGGGGIQRKEDDEEEGEEGEGEESDDQGSQSELAASALNHHQPSSNRRTTAESGELITNENNEEDGEHECDGDDDLMTSIEDSGPNKTGDKVLSTKNSSSKANTIDIEKLKQLQELNKLLLLQQQIEQQQNSDLQNHNKHQISSPLDSLTLDPTALFSSLDQQFHQHQQQQKSFPSSSGALLMKMKAQAAAAVASSDAYNFGDIFKSKPSSNSGGGGGQGGGNGGNKPSRRPLSSWKQSISACGPGPAPWVDKATLHSLGIPDELINNAVQIDYTNYVKRYGNAAECGNALCGELNYREHFHCNAASCNSRVFMKKEEMIRHFKWHKKRDESLTHGFLRCSPADNCVERFRACPHHRKQTHYHCLKRGCDKVYISTSDVQMHANYHRKDTAIIQEGFQRFRATENCLLETCAFFGQKTTHFHCRRDNCNHTFKNKADMEKHKSYHVRDETLARDGFKKFMKQEPCSFEDCRSSRVCNHIHCIRPGCAHVLHSTGQLYAHRRKHERREHELAYRKYRLAQVVHGRGGGSGSTQDLVHESFDHLPDDDSTLDTLAAQLPLAQVAAIPIEDILGEIEESRYLKHIQRHSCGSHQCHFELSTNSLDEHYCCAACSLCWLEVQHAVEHAKKHVLQEETTRLLLEETADVNVCPAECPLNSPKMRHLHCRMFGCTFALPLADRSLRKFEHYKFHEEQQRIFVASQEAACQRNSAAAASSSSLNYHPHLHQHRSSPLAGFTNHHHHHQQQQRPLLENSGSGSSSGNMEHLVKMKAAAAAAVAAAASASFSPTSSAAAASRQSGHSKSTLEGKSSLASGGGKPPRSPPTLQVFPTGTTLTSVDGLPVLKRKRGRPPKNRVSELLSNMNSSRSSNSMKNNHTSVNNSPSSSSRNPFAAALSGQNRLSSFDLAAAFNLPLKHANAISALHSNSASSTGRGVSGHGGGEDDLSKTIPIPLIMPYLRSSIHHGFYVFDEETPCPDLSCVFFGGRHYHCSKPRCYYTVNREEVLLLHSRDFHENIDIMEGFVYFDEHIDCKLPSCPSNRAAKHFHCTRVGCGFSFVHYSLMCAHEDQHRLEAEAAAAAAAAAASSSRFKRRKYNSDDDDDEEEEEGEEDDQEDADEDDDGDRQFLLNNVGNHRGQQGSDQQQRLSEDFYAMLKSGGGGGGSGANSRGRQMNEQQLSSEEQQQQQQQLMMMMAATGGGGGGGDHPLIKGNNHHQHDQQQQMSVMHSIQSYFQEQAKMNALNACLAGLNSHQGGGQVTGTTPTANSNSNSSSTLQHQLYNELNPCNSPFCKLKRKSHFHCNTCNQAFSSFERLVPHTMKRHGLPPPVPVYGGEGTASRQLSTNNNSSAEDHHNMGATGKQQLLLSSGDQPMFEHSLAEGSEEEGGAGASAEEQQQHSLLVASLQSQFAANPNLAGHFLQILMSNLMNSGAGGGAGAQQQQQQQQLMGGGGSSGSSSGLPSTSASPTLGLQTMGALPTNSGLSASAAFQQLAPTSPLYSNTPESLTAFPGRRDGSFSSDDGGNGSNASAIVADSSLFQKISQLTGQTQQKQKTPKTPKTLHQSSSGSGSSSSIKSATTGDEECSSSASSTSNGGGDGGQHLLHNNSNNNNNQLKKSSNLNTPTTTTTTTSGNSFSEEPSPKGYLRFRFNEDCGFAACVYREHQTHFHCTRKDCGYYTFCDRSRFVQHTARHDRLDSLMGGDFQQFRSSVHCGISDCPFAAAASTSTPAVSISGGGLNSSASASAGKTTHYHCLKCAYVCADTNKVVAHRRQHDKLNSITSAGFEKYAPGQDCCSKKMRGRRASGEEGEEEGRGGGGQEDGMEVDEEGGEGGSALSTCNYRLKQTHYHCTTCAYAVLGLTGMAAHKLKHQQQQQQQQQQQTFSE